MAGICNISSGINDKKNENEKQNEMTKKNLNVKFVEFFRQEIGFLLFEKQGNQIQKKWKKEC